MAVVGLFVSVVVLGCFGFSAYRWLRSIEARGREGRLVLGTVLLVCAGLVVGVTLALIVGFDSLGIWLVTFGGAVMPIAGLVRLRWPARRAAKPLGQ